MFVLVCSVTRQALFAFFFVCFNRTQIANLFASVRFLGTVHIFVFINLACILAYICTYIHVYTGTQITYPFTLVNRSVPVCMCDGCCTSGVHGVVSYIHTYIHTCIHTCIHTFVYTCILVYDDSYITVMRMCLNGCARVCASNIYIYIYIYIYINDTSMHGLVSNTNAVNAYNLHTESFSLIVMATMQGIRSAVQWSMHCGSNHSHSL
jgi:hypothetical protein